MEFSILDIPDYASSIAALISFHDITQCVLVNRDWYHLFQRHLWQTDTILDLPNHPPIRTMEELKQFEEYIIRHFDACEALSSESQYIESLTTHSLAALDKLGPAAVSLRHFRCVYPERMIMKATSRILPATTNSRARALLLGDDIDNWEWERTVAGIARGNPHLQTVHIDGYNLGRYMVDTMSALSSLLDLHLSNDNPSRSATFLKQLMDGCRSLRWLSLGYILIYLTTI